MLPGVHVETSKNQKDELQLTGNSLQSVSQSAADIQQICMVRNKDIRKVSRRIQNTCALYDVLGLHCVHSSWTGYTFRIEETLKTRDSRQGRDVLFSSCSTRAAFAKGKRFKPLNEFRMNLWHAYQFRVHYSYYS